VKRSYNHIDNISTVNPLEYGANELSQIWYNNAIKGFSSISAVNWRVVLHDIALSLPKSVHRLEVFKREMLSKEFYIKLLPHFNFGIYSVVVSRTSLKFYANGGLLHRLPLSEYVKIVSIYNNLISIANMTIEEQEED
jgi:hypothetical protein